MTTDPPRSTWFTIVTVLRAWLRTFGKSTVIAAIQEAEEREAKAAEESDDRR